MESFIAKMINRKYVKLISCARYEKKYLNDFDCVYWLCDVDNVSYIVKTDDFYSDEFSIVAIAKPIKARLAYKNILKNN